MIAEYCFLIDCKACLKAHTNLTDSACKEGIKHVDVVIGK